MKTLMIIGGTGYFGKSILSAFNRGLLNPWLISKVIVLARNTHQLKLHFPELLSDRVILLNRDISSCSDLPNADYVVHAAASSDASNYLKQPLIEKNNILLGTLNYCNLAKKFHKQSKIIYISSGAIYGQQPEDLPKIPEDYKLRPLFSLAKDKRDYAEAKRESEILIKRLTDEGLNVSIARCFAFVGQYLPLDQHFAIGNFINDGRNRREIEIKTRNLVYRSYMYSDDMVIAVMKIVENSNTQCPIFNVGSDEEVSLHQLALAISKKFDVEVLETPISEYHIDRYVPNIDKLKSELQFELSFNLKKSINSTIDLL